MPNLGRMLSPDINFVIEAIQEIASIDEDIPLYTLPLLCEMLFSYFLNSNF